MADENLETLHIPCFGYFEAVGYGRIVRGPKYHIIIGISHSSSKAEYKGDAKNQISDDPSVDVVFCGPKSSLNLHGASGGGGLRGSS